MKLKRFLCHYCTIIICLFSGTLSPVLADINLSLSDQLCSQDEIQILVQTDVAVQSFKWTGPSIIDDSKINTTINGAGIYTLTIVPVGNGITQTATIEVLDIPVEDFTISSDRVITCTEKSSLLTTSIVDTSLYTFSWRSFVGTELGTESTYNATFAGAHFLEITNALGCTKKSIVNVISDIPLHTASLRMDSLTCDEIGKLYITSPDEIIAVRWTGPLGFNSSLQNPDISIVGNYKAKITFSDNCHIEKTIKADYLNIAPDIEITGDLINCDFPEVKIIKNTNSNYQYNWSSVYSNFTSNEAEPFVDHRGLFEVRVMDNSGCEAIYYQDVKIDTITAKFDIIADTINCFQDSTVLDYNYDTTNFQSYEWSGPGINTSNKDIEKPVVNEGGLYSIIGKTMNGCPFQKNINIIKDIEPINITNGGENLIIDCKNTNQPLTVNTDRIAAQYQWFQNGELINQQKTFPASIVGNYMARVIGSNGCQDQAFYKVEGDVNTPIIIDNSITSITCKDSTALIDITVTDDNGGDEYTYTWQDENMNPTGETELSYSTADAGLYILVSQNNRNDCERTDSIIVTKDIDVPNVEIYADTINCESSQALIQIKSDTTNLSFSWDTEIGNTTNVSEIYADGSQPIILRSTAANACTSIDTVIIIQDTLSPIITLNADAFAGCSIDNLNIKANSIGKINYSYDWFTENGIITSETEDSIITIDQEGVYYTIAENTTNKCTSLDSISITVGESQLRNIDLEVADPKCSNDDDGMIVIYGIDGALGELTYGLNDNQEFQSDPLFDNLRPDEYLVKIIDGSGCTFDTIVNMQAGHSIDIEAIDAMTIDEGESITISTSVNQSGDEVNYTWYADGVINCDTCSLMTFDIYSSQTVSIIAEDENGCTDRADVHVLVNELPDIWLANIFSPSASDLINQSLPIYTAPFVQSVEAINIYDRWGNEVLAMSDLDPQELDIIWNGTHNGSKVPDGVYSVVVKYTLKSGTEFSSVQSVTIIN